MFGPPPPKRMIRADPFARGKGSDILEMAELEVSNSKGLGLGLLLCTSCCVMLSKSLFVVALR